MKDFAIIAKTPAGQVFGINGLHVLKHVAPAEGCTNRWQFQVGEITLDLIIVAEEKAKIAVLAGHYREVLKAHLRRLGTTLSRI